MIAKCQCQQCGQNVEFDAEEFQRSGETPHRFLGQIINCPTCRKPTQLYMMRQAAPEFKMAAAVNNKVVTCPDCSHEVSRNALFCPSCGAFERGLFRNIWRIASTFWLVSALFVFACLLLWKLFAAVAG